MTARPVGLNHVQKPRVPRPSDASAARLGLFGGPEQCNASGAMVHDLELLSTISGCYRCRKLQEGRTATAAGHAQVLILSPATARTTEGIQRSFLAVRSVEARTRIVTALTHHVCRNNCHGSAAASLPAMLPFSMVLPDRLRTSAYYASVMDSVWTGRELATAPADVIAASNIFAVRAHLTAVCTLRCKTDCKLAPVTKPLCLQQAFVKRGVPLQELLQHAMLRQEQPAAASQLPPRDMQTLCEPLLQRVVPEALQSTTRTTEEGSAAMLLSKTMRVCTRHAGTSKCIHHQSSMSLSHLGLPDPRDCCVQRALQHAGYCRQSGWL